MCAAVNDRPLIVVPTRNRPKEQLTQTLSTLKDSCKDCDILIVDNNDIPSIYPADDRETVVHNSLYYPVNGKYSDAEAQAIGLRRALSEERSVVVKWDDDLEPEDDCIEILVESIRRGCAAAGGVYPSFEEERHVYIVNGKLLSPDNNRRHLQFFRWQDERNECYPIHHLYSSFAYNPVKAAAVGGWYTGYHLYKHETDFTLRLNRGYGPLVIYPSAIAIHMRSIISGGTKSFSKMIHKKISREDQTLFYHRMVQLSINPDY